MRASQRSPVGIIATHSVDFVGQAFELLRQQRVMVLLRSADDQDRKSLARVEEVIEPTTTCGWGSWTHDPQRLPQTAQLVFTSGTEGRPKGVELTHQGLADVVERLNSVMKVTSEIREYVGVPVYHSFGFGRCRAVAAAGGRAYLPENGFDPLEVAEMLRKGEINAISAVPSLWRVLLGARPMFEGIGDAVRWIEIGSQYMSRDEKLAVRQLFPKANIVQHYGLTEASRSTFLEVHAVDGEALESVGRAYGDVEVALTDDGRIKIRGPHVADRLWLDGESSPALNAQGWYETQDLGSLRDGYLFFGGRADDLINCGGIKLSPEVLEAHVRERVGPAAEFAISRKPDAVRGDGILVSIANNTGLDAKTLRDAVATAAEAQGVHARGAIDTMTVDALPKTASGKVQRRKLTDAWVQTQPATPHQSAESPSSTAEQAPKDEPPSEPARIQEELRALWKEALGIDDIGLDESFYDLGGDSLTALNVIMRMGRAGIDPSICRSIFQGATIRQLVEASSPEPEPEPAAAKTDELQQIWKEALGIDDIGLDESFYDLGGDSLTALNVIMRMGRAGIDPSICRSIFQGATIRQLVEASSPAPEASSSPAKTDELKQIWQEALGVDDIGLDESFYDLGGDSLTALNVIMRMGRAGIDPSICRSIFQGATIRQLADASAPGTPPDAASQTTAAPAASTKTSEPAPLNLGYANSIMVNALRGVLIFFVVAGHWSTAIFARLPDSLSIIATALAPLFSYGTPGFAITFGVGLGYLQLPNFERNPGRLRASMRTSLMIVGSGTVALGLLATLAKVFIEGVPFSGHLFFAAFYSPLLFYTLGVATIPLWFSLTTRVTVTSQHRVRFLLGLAALSTVIQIMLDVLLADVKVTGALQLLRLMLEAKFAYFDMMSLVFVGLALGTHIKQHDEDPGAPKMLFRGGMLVLAIALIFGAITGEYVELIHWPSKNCLTKWVFYVGLVMVTISGLMLTTRRYNKLQPWAQGLLKATSTVGQLSLIFYILSALPIPLKSVLQFIGVPGPLALLLSLGAFLGVSYLLVRRVYSLMHS
ncbi:MAG: AMP-binding protein [Nannocystaceae bacterium]|nr:AMP-binding protein [Nannocystaceae bacterium]